ncbi:hypothetical protein MUP79_01675 [Candidatus Bathyarchaeota archaeon]|nr:hypothetical protein [Candidatus Bathyarchaeota archaeon]
MSKKESFGIVDEVSWVHRDKNGKIINQSRSDTRWNRLLIRLHLRKHRAIADVGMANMAGLLLSDIGGTAYDYIAIGTGTTAADHADTQLETQIGVRQHAVGTRVTTGGITNNTAQLVAEFSQAIDATLVNVVPGTPDAWTEEGVFYDAAGTTVSMLWRQTQAAENIDWDAGDTLTLTCKTQMKQGA